MRPKSLILLVLALGCGLVASIGISQVLDSNNKNQAAIETVPIYVALHNINLGDPVDDGMVSLQEWPKDKVPVGAVTKWEDIEGRRPKAIIFQGEPLNDGKFLAKGETHDPIAGIPPGMRLKTMLVDARKSAAGLLSPGDRVDMQLFVQRNEQNGIATPLYQDHSAEHPRVCGRPGRAADVRRHRRTDRRQDGVAGGHATTGQSHDDRREHGRDQPDSAQPRRRHHRRRRRAIARRHLRPERRSNREKEREAFDKEEAATTVDSQIQKEMRAAPRGGCDPPFRMKIIYPNEVSRVDFDAETGEPLDVEED